MFTTSQKEAKSWGGRAISDSLHPTATIRFENVWGDIYQEGGGGVKGIFWKNKL